MNAVREAIPGLLEDPNRFVAAALLSQGFVDGDEVECPLHGAKFHIPTGKCTKEPGGRDLACFAVRSEGGRLFVKID